MDPYIPLAVWTLGMIICVIIARKRGLKPGLFGTLLVVFLGPLAIPLMFLFKPAPQEIDPE
jgi:thiamine transporter ThiT